MNFFYKGKGGKYHGPEKQPFLSEISLYNLWVFLVEYFAIKNSTNGWNFFYKGKGGKYHSPEKQHFLSEISLYNLWGCFLQPFWSHSASTLDDPKYFSATPRVL